MLYKLKCKIGSLAAEARFTHNCERREMKEARRISAKYGSAEEVNPLRRLRVRDMRDHRIGPVRKEARCSQLAYAFLRGKKYLLTERSLKKNPEGNLINPVDWDAVEAIALRFTVDDDREAKQRFAEWKDMKLTAAETQRLETSDILAKVRLAERREAARLKREANVP